MEVLNSIIGQITNYVESLDWGYIATFILITYLLNHSKITGRVRNLLKITCRTRYRVALIGFLYGITLWFVRQSSIDQAERLFQSFIFAIVFHKLIIDLLVKKILPMNNEKDELESN